MKMEFFIFELFKININYLIYLLIHQCEINKIKKRIKFFKKLEISYKGLILIRN